MTHFMSKHSALDQSGSYGSKFEPLLIGYLVRVILWMQRARKLNIATRDTYCTSIPVAARYHRPQTELESWAWPHQHSTYYSDILWWKAPWSSIWSLTHVPWPQKSRLPLPALKCWTPPEREKRFLFHTNACQVYQVYFIFQFKSSLSIFLAISLNIIHFLIIFYLFQNETTFQPHHLGRTTSIFSQCQVGTLHLHLLDAGPPRFVG